MNSTASAHRASVSRRVPALETGEFEVGVLLAEIATEVGATLGPDTSLDIIVTPAALRLHCSRERLRDAVIQLIANAREALPRGGTISVAVAPHHHGPQAVELRIVDDGIGMARDTLQRAVEPFFTTKSTGLGGLGLTIVSHFADEIGGNFDLHSELGVGTRATLLVPLSSSSREP